MNLKGKVRIDKYEAIQVDGEWVPVKHTGTVEEYNKITINFYHSVYTQSNDDRGALVCAVTEALMPGLDVSPCVDVGNQGWVKGTVAVGQSYTAGVAGVSDSFWEIVTTVNPGASERNIRTIALTANSTSYDLQVFTVVNLPTPCVQGSAEILQITYRIINDESAIASLGTVVRDASEQQFSYIMNTSQIYWLPINAHILPYDNTAWGKGIPRGANYNGYPGTGAGGQEHYFTRDATIGFSESIDQSEGVFGYTYYLRLGIDNVSTSHTTITGQPIKGMALGLGGRHTSVSDIVTGTESRVQNIFGRAADTGALDRTPFLSNSIISTSAASIDLVDKGDWYDYRTDSYLLPYMYRVTIETGGNTGVATYKLQRRRWTRWERNRPYWTSYGLPFLHFSPFGGSQNDIYMDITTADTRKHGQTIWHSRAYDDSVNDLYLNHTSVGDAGSILLRYVHPEFISFDYDGITVGSLQEHNWTNLDANSAQAQTFTEILQVSTDGLDIYIADASQGLYQVLRDHDDMNTSNWTINKIGPPGITDDTSCRGVFHKGGTYWGGPGKIVDVNIVRGGSNYAVGNTVSVSGVNGTSFAANVARVDADGAIEAISITNRGSGYIEDHCQLYVSTGSGVGAQLEPIIGAGGEMWAIFDDTTDSVTYMAKMTHVLPVSATTFNLDTTADTITRTGGDWIADGFRAGQVLHIKSAENAANEGRYTIASVDSATQITLNENITTTNSDDTQAQIYAESWEVMRETVNTGAVSFTYNENSPSADTITRGAGSFITDGFVEGMKIDVTGTSLNDGTYTIASVAALTLTLDDSDDLAAETVSSTIYALTDFTLTNYTSGTPGGSEIIGLLIDHDHVDERLCIFTPNSKIINNGTTSNGGSNGGHSWWSPVLSSRAYASFDTSTGVDGTGEVITTDAAHGFGTGQEVTYSQNGGSTNVGLTDATQYFVHVLSSTTLSLHTTRDNAIDDASRVDLTSGAAETHLLTADQGTNDVRYAGNENGSAIAGEQIATVCMGPLSGDGQDEWLTSDTANYVSLQTTWGQNTGAVARTDVALYGRYAPHRCKTNFDVGVIGQGSDGTNFLKSNRTLTNIASAGSSDSIITAYLDDPANDNTDDLRPGRWGSSQGGFHGTMGHGLFWGRMANDGSRNSGYIFSPNGTGLLADEADLPYGFWQEFGWDGTRWVLDNAGARTAHAQVSFSGTSLNINSTTGAIVGSGGGFTNWATDGFEVGDIITIANATDALNNGSYVIESLSGTTLTVTPDKLPATTNAADGTATVVGDHAIIDGLALSFDTTGGALVVDEYYDCYVYDGIINDNATSGNISMKAPILPTKTGTTFSSATIPTGNVGAVVNEPMTIAQKNSARGTNGAPYYFSTEPGHLMAPANYNSIAEIVFGEQIIPASTDFTFRFKAAGSCANPNVRCGVAPATIALDATVNHSYTSLDYNLQPVYDYANNPTCDIYYCNVRSTGNGTATQVNFDRVVLKEVDGVTPIDETYYDGTGSNGTFIGGYESATDNHAALDVITMDDGTTVRVDAVDANGTITQFTITSNSTKSSGNSQIGAVSSSATSINFTTGTNVITRTAGGTDFVTDGFVAGMKIQVDGATTEGNDGAYTIASVTTTTITTEENLTNSETGTSATIQHAIVQTATTGSGVNFALIPGTANLEPADVGNDEFALNRRGTTGDNLYWTVNGVEFHRYTSGPFNDSYAPGWSNVNLENVGIQDANLDYTIDRRMLTVGNGTTTGTSDPNFRCLPTSLAGTDSFRLYYNDGSGPVEFTYITDGRTAPADGEVTIMPYSGRLWFNSAQGGDTITGNWTTTLKFNIE